MRAHSSRMVVLTAFALAIGLAGCASGGGGGGGSRPAGATNNRIVQAELDGLEPLSAMQAIQRLRPQWFRARGGGGGASGPILYVDGVRRSVMDELNAIRSSDVERMEYMSAMDANNRFGTGHPAGAIMVTMRR